MNILVIGDNELTSTRCIYASGNLTITGNGLLDLSNCNDSISCKDLTIDGTAVIAHANETYAGAIFSSGFITIQNGADVQADASGNSFAFWTQDGFSISDSTLKVDSDSKPAFNVGLTKITSSIENSTVIANSESDTGFNVDGPLSIKSSDVTVSAGSGFGMGAQGITIDGCQIEVTVKGVNSNAIYSWNAGDVYGSIQILKSDVYAEGSYPALYAYGKMVISDSTVEAISVADYAIWAVGGVTLAGDSRVEATGAEGFGAVGNGPITIDPEGMDVDIWVGADGQSAEKMEGSPFSESFTTDSIDDPYFLYEVHDPYSDIPPIIWDDDDEYIPPIVPVQQEDLSDDDTVTIVACAAAAVVAALMAAFLILDRRH